MYGFVHCDKGWTGWDLDVKAFKTFIYGYPIPCHMPIKGEGRIRDLLRNKDVERWFKNLQRGSPATADNYARILSRFLAANKLTPSSILKMDAKKRDDLLADHIDSLLNKGRAGTYVVVYKKVIASWLSWNDQHLVKHIKIPMTRSTTRNDIIPQQVDLKHVFNVSDAREKVAISFMAFSGVREEVLGSYRGDKGIRLRDLPEVKIMNGKLVFDKVPTRVVVIEGLSKTGRPYFTFLGPEGCEYLNDYIQERMNNGEAITPDSAIISLKTGRRILS